MCGKNEVDCSFTKPLTLFLPWDLMCQNSQFCEVDCSFTKPLTLFLPWDSMCQNSQFCPWRSI